MKFKDSISAVFKVICIFATLFITGAWIDQYLKNEDTTLVDYKSMNDMEDVLYPELSICFIFDENWKVNGANNTELMDLFQSIFYEWKPWANQTGGNCRDLKNCPDIIFNILNSKPEYIGNCRDLKNCPYFIFKNQYTGFVDEDFFRCFAIEIEHDYTRYLSKFGIIFKPHLIKALQNELKGLSVGGMNAILNYPNQFLRTEYGVLDLLNEQQQDLLEQHGEYSIVDEFHIQSFEVIRRRNKQQSPCLDQWEKYDRSLLERKVESVGCKPPFMKDYDIFPECDNPEKIKEFDGRKLARNKFIPDPCLEMPRIDYRHKVMQTEDAKTTIYGINVIFPSYLSRFASTKVVTYGKKFDEIALLGNIGGYVGLFLGIVKYFLLF